MTSCTQELGMILDDLTLFEKENSLNCKIPTRSCSSLCKSKSSFGPVMRTVHLSPSAKERWDIPEAAKFLAAA